MKKIFGKGSGTVGALACCVLMAACGGSNSTTSNGTQPKSAVAPHVELTAESLPAGDTPPTTSTGSSPYITVQNGHLYRNGQRVRFWGMNLQAHFLQSYAEIDNAVKRLQAFGFNGVRLWTPQETFYTLDANGVRVFRTATKGDLSPLDRFDYLVSKLAAAGIAIDMTILHNIGTSTLNKDPDPEIRAWAATTETSTYRPNQLRILFYAPYVSTAWRSMLLTHQQKVLERANLYTGRKYADEPAVSTWELMNEAHFVDCSLDANCFNNLPSIAKKALSDKWVNSSWNPAHTALPDDLATLLSSSNYTNFAHFVAETFDNYSQEMRTAAKKMGPGVAAQPFIFNTGPGQPHAIAQYAHSKGDIVSVDGYRSPMAPTVTGGYEASPWQPVSMGGKMPNMMYASKVINKPMVIYETSFYRPYPYRAEWGPIMAAYGLKQDWDAVYLYATGNGKVIYGKDKVGADADYGTQPLPEGITATENFTRGFQHGGDPVAMSSWALGGRLFRSVTESPAIQYKWTLTEDVIFSSSQKNNSYGFPPGFMNHLLVAKEATVAVEYVKSTTVSCLPCDYRSTAPQPTTFGVQWDPSTASSTPQKMRMWTTNGGTVVVGHLSGDLGTLIPGVSATMTGSGGFGAVGALKTNITGQAYSNKTLMMIGRVRNTGYVFDPAKVDLRYPYGAVYGVTNEGTAPLVYEGPAVTFNTTVPYTFTPYAFNRSPLSSGVRASTYTVDAKNAAIWVTAQP